MMQNLIRYIVEQLVDEKEAIVIEENNESEKVVVVNIKVVKGDIGKVIGRNGKVAASIRTIVKSASAKSGKRYIVKIGEKEEA